MSPAPGNPNFADILVENERIQVPCSQKAVEQVSRIQLDKRKIQRYLDILAIEGVTTPPTIQLNSKRLESYLKDLSGASPNQEDLLIKSRIKLMKAEPQPTSNPRHGRQNSEEYDTMEDFMRLPRDIKRNEGKNDAKKGGDMNERQETIDYGEGSYYINDNNKVPNPSQKLDYVNNEYYFDEEPGVKEYEYSEKNNPGLEYEDNIDANIDDSVDYETLGDGIGKNVKTKIKRSELSTSLASTSAVAIVTEKVNKIGSRSYDIEQGITSNIELLKKDEKQVNDPVNTDISMELKKHELSNEHLSNENGTPKKSNEFGYNKEYIMPVKKDGTLEEIVHKVGYSTEKIKTTFEGEGNVANPTKKKCNMNKNLRIKPAEKEIIAKLDEPINYQQSCQQIKSEAKTLKNYQVIEGENINHQNKILNKNVHGKSKPSGILNNQEKRSDSVTSNTMGLIENSERNSVALNTGGKMQIPSIKLHNIQNISQQEASSDVNWNLLKSETYRVTANEKLLMKDDESKLLDSNSNLNSGPTASSVEGKSGSHSSNNPSGKSNLPLEINSTHLSPLMPAHSGSESQNIQSPRNVSGSHEILVIGKESNITKELPTLINAVLGTLESAAKSFPTNPHNNSSSNVSVHIFDNTIPGQITFLNPLLGQLSPFNPTNISSPTISLYRSIVNLTSQDFIDNETKKALENPEIHKVEPAIPLPQVQNTDTQHLYESGSRTNKQGGYDDRTDRTSPLLVPIASYNTHSILPTFQTWSPLGNGATLVQSSTSILSDPLNKGVDLINPSTLLSSYENSNETQTTLNYVHPANQPEKIPYNSLQNVLNKQNDVSSEEVQVNEPANQNVNSAQEEGNIFYNMFGKTIDSESKLSKEGFLSKWFGNPENLRDSQEVQPSMNPDQIQESIERVMFPMGIVKLADTGIWRNKRRIHNADLLDKN